MPLRKTEAVVLRSIKQGETSKILTLYTRSFGKIKVIAKGARSSKSRFGGSLEPLNYISVLFYYKETRDLHTLSQADIVKPFAKSQQDLRRSTLALAVCELVDRLEVGASPNPALFRLLVQTLEAVQEVQHTPLNCLRAFEVRLLDLLGIKPNVATCLACGKSAVRGAVWFDVVRGGFFCPGCGETGPVRVRLESEALQALRHLQRHRIDALNGWSLSAVAGQQVDRFLTTYLQYHQEGFRELKALRVYRELNHEIL